MSDPEYIGRIAAASRHAGWSAPCAASRPARLPGSTDAELPVLPPAYMLPGERLLGCWECPLFPCGEGMFSSAQSSSRRLTAFVRCVREDGADALASYLAANEAQGLLYHRDTVHFTGDYDISEDEAEILRLLREGSKP
ncbi:MAG: hypothetical protein ACLSWY_00670 [Ruthenibacterium lactatiformans]